MTTEQKEFIDKTDSDLTTEVWEESMLFEDLEFNEFYEKYQAKHLNKYGDFLQPLFIGSDSLRFGHLGNGVTVYTTSHEKQNDFLTLAHIEYNRTVKFYYQVDQATKAKIEQFAARENMSISETQKDQFALTPKN